MITSVKLVINGIKIREVQYRCYKIWISNIF